MSDEALPQPGWYPDPAAPTWSLRYWDGEQWTDKTTPRPTAQHEAPRVAPAAAGGAEPEAAEGGEHGRGH